MRPQKQDRTASLVIRGHAFIQNLRRGHYELGSDARPRLTLAAAFDELERMISPPKLDEASEFAPHEQSMQQGPFQSPWRTEVGSRYFTLDTRRLHQEPAMDACTS